MVGKPTHFKPKNHRAVCGVEDPEYFSHDPHDCNCIKCRRTHAYAEKISLEKNK